MFKFWCSTLRPKPTMKRASTMLKIGSKYQKEGFTLMRACDMTIDIAKTVEIKVLMTE